MSMVSALMNHRVVAGSSHHGSKNNGSDGSFKVLAWNHNVIKGKHLLLRDKVASTGWQIVKAVPEKSINAIHLRTKKKWWEKNMNANMRNIKTRQDFHEQLQMAGGKLTVVHFFSPSCGACKALRYVNWPGCIQDCNFLWSTTTNRKRFVIGSMSMYCHCSAFTEVQKVVSLASAAPFQLHGIKPERLGPEKGLEESELQSFAPTTDIPNATADASHNMDGDVDTVAPSNDYTSIL